MATSKSLQQKSFVQTVIPLAKTQQFYWYLGHVFGIIFFIMNTVVSLYSRSLKYYKLALLSILATYVIVIKQIHFKGSGVGELFKLLNPDFRVKLIRDENVQYFILAAIYYLTSPIIGQVSGALYSFTTFSIFHALTYFQNNFLHALPLSLNRQQSINSTINQFTSTFNQQALLLAANAEFLTVSGFLFSLPLMVFRIFGNPLFVITNTFVFASIVVFLKLRYDSNKYTQSVVSDWDLKINQLLTNALCPPSLGMFYNHTFKNLLAKYVGPIHIPKAVKRE